MLCSLIIPCYNEARNIPLLLAKCEGLLQNQDIEIILVDNGSTDTTRAVLREILPLYPSCRSVHVEKNQGYGFGILSGLKSAKGEFLAWTHADMQTDPNDVIEGLRLIKQYGPDIFIKGKRVGRPISDTFFTLGMGLFESMLLQKSMWDINAQPTVFPRYFYERWENPPHDFSLDLYAYFRAKEAKLSFHRFPVQFGMRAHGTSHWNINWRSKIKFIQRTLSFSLQLRKNLKRRPGPISE